MIGAGLRDGARRSAERVMRSEANGEVLRRFAAAEPILIDVRSARDVVPGMTQTTVLTSGAPLPCAAYRGGQRNAILHAAVYEGLARDVAEAEARLARNEIRIAPCHHHGCVGSVAGVYTATMPVFMVRNAAAGNLSFCNFYEGESRRRLNYGSFGPDVVDGLTRVRDVLAPVIGEAVRSAGGIRLKPIMRRALHMGDELHSRNTAATALFARELFPFLIDIAGRKRADVLETIDVLSKSDYFFLRLSMAAAKGIADAGHGVEGASVVTAMAYSSRDFSIRVSGLGDEWFRGPMPTVDAKFFDGFGPQDIDWIGGESIILETVGFGGLSQAAAFALQDYQGGSPSRMMRSNEEMYRITIGEHPDYRIPAFGFRGIPLGIDIVKVVETGITPCCDVGLAGKSGGQIGAGLLRPPIECFRAAYDNYQRRYGRG
jgi:hypothetical protein